MSHLFLYDTHAFMYSRTSIIRAFNYANDIREQQCIVYKDIDKDDAVDWLNHDANDPGWQILDNGEIVHQ